ncbi:hypothetical protein ACROYT_G003023 [Oculina patagonica]
MDPETTAIQKIQSKGNRPEDWLEFLALQRSRAAAGLTDETCRHLLYLYERAVSQIPAEENKRNFSYARLLVEFAQLQMRISEDDARSTFQLARSNAKHFAIVFVAWAQFELSTGNKSKCRGLLRKGKDFGAQPMELLIKAYDNFVAGKKVLIEDCEELTDFTSYRGKQKSSESSVDLSPLSTGDDSSTGTGTLFTDSGTSKVADNTSAVISFKLPSVLESCGKKQVSCRRSNSSSSSDEADTIPFQTSANSHRQRGSMSTQKPSVKSTPDVKSGTDSLAACMNLSVRRNKARRTPGGGGIAFGLPMRVKMTLPATLPSVSEPGDELDGITELESTVDESRQSCELEVASTSQRKSSVRTASSSSETERDGEQRPPTLEVRREAFAHRQEKSSENATVESQSVFASQTTDSQVCNQQQNSSMQEGSQSFTTNPHSATINNISRQQGDGANSSRQQTLHQMATPHHQIPTPQEQTPLSNSISGSCTIQRQSSSSITPVVHGNGSFSQQNIPQVSHSGHIQAIPGQFHGAGYAPGYPPDMQFARPAVVPAQAPQETIVVKGKTYQKLGTIGKGGSSKVFQAFDGKRICAIKYVNLEEADDFIVQSYINEVQLLERLQGNDNIVKLFDWELCQEKNHLILVMECGSIDLAGFLRKNRTKITEGELQVFWRQMLEAVHVIHEARIIHSDLKPANFLLVEGRLKLIDFGIANALQGDKTSIELNTQVGTLNFMSPEAFQDISHAPRFDNAGNAKPRMKIGRASDVWSLGCILYMMVYGKTPFQHITNHVVKLQCIMDPSHVIEFPDIKDKRLLDVMKGCLRRSPKERYTIPHLLTHPYIDPSAHDPLVEIEDEDKMFDVLMEFAKADVNSPRSVRALSKSFYKQLLTSKKAQKALKPPHASGNAKYMRGNANEQNKENADLNGLLKHELVEKYKNALPHDTSESTFEQTWNTTYGK